MRYDFKCTECMLVEERSLSMSQVHEPQHCSACGALMKRKYHPLNRVYRKYEGQFVHPDMNLTQAEDAFYNAIEETDD